MNNKEERNVFDEVLFKKKPVIPVDVTIVATIFSNFITKNQNKSGTTHLNY